MVAAYETSLRDERGKRRAEFGLADVFGVKFVSGPRGIGQKHLCRDLGQRAPGQPRAMKGHSRIMGGTRLIRRRSRSARPQTPFLYVPDFPGPADGRGLSAQAPDGPAVIARETGTGGRSSIFRGTSARSFGSARSTTVGLIANAVRWALGEPPRVDGDGPGVLDIALREDGEGMAVSCQPHQSDDDERSGP